MAITVTVPAESRGLTTLSAVKDTKVVGSTTRFDSQLLQLIGAASDAIEYYVQHVFARQTYVETVNGSAHPVLMLTNTPIVAVTGIVCRSEPITDFEVRDADQGTIYRQVGWQMSAWVGWSTGQEVIPGTGDLIYAVTYEAGFLLPGEADANLPKRIEQACIETVVDWYRGGKRDSRVKSKKVGDLAISYKDAASGGEAPPLPAGARALLSRRIK
jgi:hypothetical protein